MASRISHVASCVGLGLELVGLGLASQTSHVYLRGMSNVYTHGYRQGWPCVTV